MDQYTLNLLVVGASFALYIGIAIWARAGTTAEFYAAGQGVPPVMNGMATAADWMSAASFISMAGLIAAVGYGNSTFLMGWTGGYVLLALLLAPYLRKFGKFTVPQFIGDRFYSRSARLVAVVSLIVISVTYVIGQMTGAGVAFSRFLEVQSSTGLWIASGIVFIYAVLGGMKGITYTQVAQYCVLIIAYTIPALFISLQLTGNILPQLGLIDNLGRLRSHGLQAAGLLVVLHASAPPGAHVDRRKGSVLHEIDQSLAQELENCEKRDYHATPALFRGEQSSKRHKIRRIAHDAKHAGHALAHVERFESDLMMTKPLRPLQNLSQGH